MTRATRTDQDYAIDALQRGLKVLEALEGTNFEPVSTKRVAERTGFSYDFCMRALRTLKVAGFAAETKGGWMVGTKLMRFGTNFNEVCIAMLNSGNSENSDAK